MALPKTTTQDEFESMNRWFSGTIATLRMHQKQLNHGNAPAGMKEAYDEIIEAGDDYAQMFALHEKIAKKRFFLEMLTEYIESGISENEAIIKLAFSFENKNLLVWAEIEDDNEKVEFELFSLAGKINAEFFEYGFQVQTTVVEQYEKIELPKNFRSYKPQMTTNAEL